MTTPSPISPVTLNTPSPSPADMVPFKGLGDSTGLVASRMVADLTPEMVATKMAAEVEKAIRIQLAAERAALKVIDSALTDLHTARSNYLRDCPKTYLPAHIEDFQAALRPFGFSASGSFAAAEYDTVNRRISMTMSVRLSNEATQATTLTRTYTFDADPTIIYLQREIEKTERRFSDQQAVVRSTNSALLNIGSIEREARASVITKIMEASPDGKAILDGFAAIDVKSAVSYLQTM